MTMPPVYYKGLIYVGMSGGEFGARGSMTAYRASDGAIGAGASTPARSRATSAARTWAAGEWMTCGSTVWSYPAIDTETDTMYFSTVERRPVDGPRARARTCSRRRSSRSTRSTASTATTSRWCTTTSGTTTARRRRSCST